MSQLGKIFLWVALVGALVALAMGYLVMGQYNTTKETLSQVNVTIVSQKQQIKQEKAAADAATQAQQQSDTQLKESQSKVDDLTSKLTDAEKKETDLETAVKTSQDASTKAQSALDHINTVLKGATPEDVEAMVDKMTAQVASDNAEQKILQDQLQAASKQVADLKVAINNVGKISNLPPGLSGKVTFVNSTWGFVVLNIGLSSGVVPNGELIVYRGRNFLGKVKVTSAEDTTAVADILPGAKAIIQVGDDVLD